MITTSTSSLYSSAANAPGSRAKRVAIIQSNYVPWKGFFDLINAVDEYIILDSVQFTRRDWRTRNRIKTAGGERWLSIPVSAHQHRSLRINEVEIANADWSRRHWDALRSAYLRTPFFAHQARWLEPLYQDLSSERLLTRVNERLLRAICAELGIGTVISRDTDYALPRDESASARLLSLCLQTGASAYVSGPSARAYLDTSLFEAQGVEVNWMEYADYPIYPQPHGPFRHEVSILDLLFCTGPSAREYALPRG